FCCEWGCSGWLFAAVLGAHIHSNGWQPILPFALALAGFITGYFCHRAAYAQLYLIGAERNVSFILEDLWVNFDVAVMLHTVATTPIKDWKSFYSLQGEGYKQKKRYADAIANYTMAIINAPKDANAYILRGHA